MLPAQLFLKTLIPFPGCVSVCRQVKPHIHNPSRLFYLHVGAGLQTLQTRRPGWETSGQGRAEPGWIRGVCPFLPLPKIISGTFSYKVPHRRQRQP